MTIKPKRISFGRVFRDGSTKPKTVIITPGDAGPVTPKLVPVEVQGLKAELREIVPGERYEIEVSVTPPFKNDRLRTDLKLETGVAQAPVVAVSVYATVPPRVSVLPRRFIRVPDVRESVWEQAVRVVWNDGSVHKVVEATVDDPRLEVRIDEQDGQQQVVLQVPQEYELRTGRRTIHIKTDDAEAPELTVQVMGGRRPRPRPKPKPNLKKPGTAVREAQPSQTTAAPTTQPAKEPSGLE